MADGTRRPIVCKVGGKISRNRGFSSCFRQARLRGVRVRRILLPPILCIWVYNQLSTPHCHPHLACSRPDKAVGTFALNTIRQSTIPPPNPDLTCKMSDALQTTPYTHLYIHDDPEGLQSAQEKKPPLPSVFSWPLSFKLARRYPFLSSVVISMVITGTISAFVRLSHTQDKRNPYSRIPPNANGVSGIAGSGWILVDHVSQVVLIGHSDNFDEPTRGLTMQWEILGCGEYRLTTSYSPMTKVLEAVGCDALGRAVDIYFNK